MKSTKYLGCCSMNRYCDFWCTDVWRWEEKWEGIYGAGWRRKRRRRRDACVHLVRRELGDAGSGPLAALRLFATRWHRVSLLLRFTVRVRIYQTLPSEVPLLSRYLSFFGPFFRKVFCFFHNIENAANLLIFYCGRQKCTFWKSVSRQLISIKSINC